MSRDHHRARSHRSRDGEGGQHPPGQERPAQCAERDGGKQQNRGYGCRLVERAGAECFRLFLLQSPVFDDIHQSRYDNAASSKSSEPLCTCSFAAFRSGSSAG